jgi:selenium metabolism protein YedF
MNNVVDPKFKRIEPVGGAASGADAGSDSKSDAVYSKALNPEQTRFGGYYIDIGKEESVSNISLSISMYTNLVLLVGSSVLGRGDDQQGSSLMNSLFYSISRLESVPATIILINSGVFLVSEGSPILEYLKSLEKRGVEIISSASCLEYYNLQDKLMVGYSSNMYSITEKMFTAARLISL